jgi:hypothetical protein
LHDLMDEPPMQTLAMSSQFAFLGSQAMTGLLALVGFEFLTEGKQLCFSFWGTRAMVEGPRSRPTVAVAT